MATRRQIQRERRLNVGRAPLGVGAVLAGSARAIGANLGPFTALALMTYLPAILITIYPFFVDGRPVGGATASAIALARVGAYALCGWSLAVFLVRGTYEHVRGRRISLSAMLSHGMSRLGPALVVSLLVAIFVGGVLVAVIIPFSCAAGAMGRAAPVGALLGGLLAAVLAAMLMCRLWVAVAAVVVERCGIMEALTRSSSLTEGTRWQVFAVIFVIQFSGGIVGFALGAVGVGMGNLMIVEVGGLLAQIAFGTWGAVAAVVGYYELRRSREGLDLEDLADVFA